MCSLLDSVVDPKYNLNTQKDRPGNSLKTFSQTHSFDALLFQMNKVTIFNDILATHPLVTPQNTKYKI